jgi:hypothetical protein
VVPREEVILVAGANGVEEAWIVSAVDGLLFSFVRWI